MNEMIETLKVVRLLCSDKRGVTSLEYGLIAALVGSALVAGMGVLGPKLTQIFKDIAAKLVL